jgi:methylated-DNA-[protein]-cysteine S-methyltransferase
MERIFYGFDSPLGEILIEARDETPVRIILPGSGMKSQMPVTQATSAIRKTAGQLSRYFDGGEGDKSYPGKLLDAQHTSDFTRRVLETVAAIPWGETASYGEVAAMAGSPGAARAVGGVMASNPFPIIIPCHRVVRSDGSMGGFGGGEHMKSWLLAFES